MSVFKKHMTQADFARMSEAQRKALATPMSSPVQRIQTEETRCSAQTALTGYDVAAGAIMAGVALPVGSEYGHTLVALLLMIAAAIFMVMRPIGLILNRRPRQPAVPGGLLSAATPLRRLTSHSIMSRYEWEQEFACLSYYEALERLRDLYPNPEFVHVTVDRWDRHIDYMGHECPAGHAIYDGRDVTLYWYERYDAPEPVAAPAPTPPAPIRLPTEAERLTALYRDVPLAVWLAPEFTAWLDRRSPGLPADEIEEQVADFFAEERSPGPVDPWDVIDEHYDQMNGMTWIEIKKFLLDHGVTHDEYMKWRIDSWTSYTRVQDYDAHMQSFVTKVYF